MIVWISGPTGSGKSSFTNLLGGTGYAVIREVLQPDVFEAFGADPSRHCAPLQEAIMRSRFEQWRSLKPPLKVAFDRSLDEDVEVFCRMHHEAGLINETESRRLRTLGSELLALMPEPDLIVYMSPSRRVLAERVTPATHPPPIIDGLDRQLVLYEEWLESRQEDVLRLDNSACSLQSVQRFLSKGS